MDEIQLYDNPVLKEQITSGEIRFFAADSEISIPAIPFKELPDDSSKLTVSGPAKPVKAIEIIIGSITSTTLDAATSDARTAAILAGRIPGIAEIIVVGHRVDQAVEEGNLIDSTHVKHKVDDILVTSLPHNAYYLKTQTGLNRSTLVKDGNLATAWVTDYSGKNTNLQ